MGGAVRIIKSIFSPPSAPSLPAPAPAPVARAVQPLPMAKVPAPIDPAELAPEVEAPPAITEQETLLKKKKKGRYNTLLTGEKGALGSPNIERKSLLGN